MDSSPVYRTGSTWFLPREVRRQPPSTRAETIARLAIINVSDVFVTGTASGWAAQGSLDAGLINVTGGSSMLVRVVPFG